MLKSWWRPVWCLLKGLLLWEWLVAVAIAVFFAYFFYRSIWALPFMLPIGVGFLWWNGRKKAKQQEQYFLEQFKECILSVAASMRAGYAVENAFLESMADMKMMFGEDCEMVRQLGILQKGLRNNETLENLLYAMARNSGGEDVLEFAEVFSIAKRNSGNVADTIGIYSSIIMQKLETAQEIQTLLSAKRLEQRVMNVMPFGIVLYLDYSNPGYFDMMFHNLSGVLIMSGSLVVYLVAFFMAEKIFVNAYE